jgi:uncharacterized protein with NRDE domain
VKTWNASGARLDSLPTTMAGHGVGRDNRGAMCLLAVLFRTHPEAPLVVAANRDEWLERPAKPMQVLRPTAPRILGGRDVLAGGTWLAVNEHGLCAGLTNRPSIGMRDPSRRSRGELPLMLAEHVCAAEAVATFQEKVRCSEYNPCWLLVGDRDDLFYIVLADTERPVVTRLVPGAHVLENRPLDAFSAKVEMIRRALNPVGTWLGPTLVDELHRVLRSHDVPADEPRGDMPEKADPRPSEVRSACVHAAAYGTRSAAVIVVPPHTDIPPKVHYADGPPCTAPLMRTSHLWRAPEGARAHPPSVLS